MSSNPEPIPPAVASAPPVSVVILTLDEAINLPDCLDSCAWCDDVHVLDSGSTDGTVAIAQSRGVPVHIHPFTSFADQRNWAIDHIPTKHPWVFHLDADERFTPELVAEMATVLGHDGEWRKADSESPISSRSPIRNPQSAISAAPAAVDAFRVPHKMMLHGTWLRRSEGYPVYQVRLFHKDRMRFVDHGHGQREPATARLGTLREPYLHEAYRRGVFDWVARHNVHSQKEAEAIVRGDGAKAPLLDLFRFDFRGRGGDRTRRRRALKAWSYRLPARPRLRWLSILFLQRGFLDGPAAWRYADLMRLYDDMTMTKVRMLRSEQDHV